MKQDKVFVRYKNFSDNQGYNRDRQSRRPTGGKKVYAQKNSKPRQAVRQVIESYQPLTEIPSNVLKLIDTFPSFFTDVSHNPEKDINQYLNEYVIFNAKKYVESLHIIKKDNDHHSSSDPDWNSDDDIDGNMESQKIDEAIVEKVVEKFGDKLVKKQDLLKRHEKQFLEDYFRTKRLQEQDELDRMLLQKQNNIQLVEKIPEKVIKPIQKAIEAKVPEVATKVTEKPRNIWSEYHQKQVNNFVDMGFMTKVEDFDDEIEAEVAEDDGMFASDNESKQAEQKSSSQDSDEDDIFGDEGPTTIKTTYTAPVKEASEKQITKGTVFINDQLFSKIAEEIGLYPLRCVWIISNDNNKFRVSTEYMDTIYRKEKMNEILPLISLNHSEFVNNDDVETATGLQIFRKYNARRENKNQIYPKNNRFKHQYKQKVPLPKKK